MFTSQTVLTSEPLALTFEQILIYCGIILAITLVFYLLRSFGLYSLAKKNNVANSWLAFIPFFWMYIACKLIKQGNFFNKPFTQLALILAIVFTVAEVVALAIQVISYFPLFEYVFIHKKTIYLSVDELSTVTGFREYFEGGGILVEENFIPYGEFLVLMNNILSVLSTVSAILSIAGTIIEVFVYINLFKNYWPQNYTLASILSIFIGLFPVLVFVIRNKKAIDFNEYIRSRYGARYGAPYNTYNPYGNPYNPYGQNGGQNQASGSQDPYANFKPEEPFSEFNNDNNDND
jgi:hypothetical protein